MEFAILLPFLMFVFVAGTDWCRIYYAAHTLDECARSGALAGSGIAYQERGLSAADRETRAKTAALDNATNLDPPLAEAGVVVATAGNYVTVTVNYDFQMIVPYLGNGGTWNLSRSVRMPVLP